MLVINPANEQIIGEFKVDSKQSIQEKFEQAKAEQEKWAGLNVTDRVEWVSRYKELLLGNIDDLALTLTREMGKPLSQSIGEIKGATERLDFFSNNSEKYLAEEIAHESATHIEKIIREPLGIVVNISAWNFPYNIGFNVFVPAVIAGNAVLYKPSEVSPETGRKMIKLMIEAGVPKDLVHVIQGGGEVGAELLKLDVQGVFFTGSYKTGASIYSAVTPKMIPCQLELGGKDPVYISADNSDINSVADAMLEGVFWNNGQSCCAVERIYVHTSHYNSFVQIFTEKANAMKVGDPMDALTFIGPLARKEQVQVLSDQTQDAISKGANLLLGGKPLVSESLGSKGYYFEPTVLSGVDHTMKVMRDESFGPIIGIQEVFSDEEAVKLMKDTEYGLSSAVFSDSFEKAEPILKAMNSGTVYWNCCDRVSPHTPWSGRKNSGIGSTLSYLGIQAFTQPKSYQIRKQN